MLQEVKVSFNSSNILCSTLLIITVNGTFLSPGATSIFSLQFQSMHLKILYWWHYLLKPLEVHQQVQSTHHLQKTKELEKNILKTLKIIWLVFSCCNLHCFFFSIKRFSVYDCNYPINIWELVSIMCYNDECLV